VAVKIKLMRLGRIRQPYYRIVVADARTRRNGKAIETIGKYHPKEQPSLIEVDSERVQYWLGVGAQPTEPVQHLLEVTGDWQRFKGLPGAEGTLRRADAKPDKAELFNQALAQAGEVPTTEATTPRKKSGRQADTSGAADKVTAERAAPEKGAEPATTASSGQAPADDREDTATTAGGQV
jgi:small subunit ribosomal protein S16